MFGSPLQDKIWFQFPAGSELYRLYVDKVQNKLFVKITTVVKNVQLSQVQLVSENMIKY